MEEPASQSIKPSPWGHIAVALATGASIVGLAYVSRRVLVEPIDPLLLVVPGLLFMMYELLLPKHRAHSLMKAGVWVAAVLILSVVIVVMASL